MVQRSPFMTLLARDITLGLRVGGGGSVPVVFFVIVVAMVPFAVGAETRLLSDIAPGMIWIGVLLASLLSLDRLFQADFDDGSFELFLYSGLPVPLIVVAKCLAFWMTTALPLILAAPILGILLNLPLEVFVSMVIALVLGTPALTLIGAVGAALTVGLRRGGLLLSLLSLPFCVPVLIFGVGASSGGELAGANLMLLTAVSLIACVFGPWASAAALRLNLT